MRWRTGAGRQGVDSLVEEAERMGIGWVYVQGEEFGELNCNSSNELGGRRAGEVSVSDA